ncbi:MAG TPA: hypothetical protein V6C65_40815 [Allocoleopsis sp.]
MESNEFYAKLEQVRHKNPSAVRQASTLVFETLDLSIAAAQALFHDQATPDVVFAIYDRIVAEANRGKLK